MAEVAIPAAIGGISAAGSMMQQDAANASASRGQKLAVQAAEANKTLVDQSTQSKLEVLASKFSQYNKAVVASASVRGASGASTEAIKRASLYSALLDQTNTLQEGESQKVAIDTGAASQVNQYQSQKGSSLFAGISGGLQGLQAGMSMVNSFQQAGWMSTPTKKGP